MSKTEVKKIIKASNGIGFFSTIDGSTPRVRPMALTLSRDGMFYTSTFTKSPKMKQLQKNKRIEVCFSDPKMQHVRITAQVKVIKDAKQKAAYYKKNKHLKMYFKSPEDPNFTLLEVKPRKVMLMKMGDMKYSKVDW